MYALTNCDIYTGKEVLGGYAILVEGAKIRGLIPAGQISSDIRIVDLGGKSIAPGFIDIQVNGGGGLLFNESLDMKSLEKIVAAHRRFGTTDMLPTFITGSMADMIRATEVIREAIDRRTAGVLGLHFEGPFLNPSKAGVHNKAFMKSPERRDLEMVVGNKAGILLMTVAPEVVSDEDIKFLVSRGVLVAAGHSNATYEQGMHGFSSGITLTTHLFNAMSAFQGRETGLIGAALDHPGSWCSIIVDGHHVHFASLNVAISAKSKSRMFLVTDAMPPVGSEETETFMLGELRAHVENGACRTDDGTLAGSALDMATAVRNLVQKMGIAKDEALRMASTYPATFLGLEGQRGFIAPGYDANMVIFNNQILVEGVIIQGEVENFS